MIPHHRKIALGPRCPACQTRLPFRATQLGLGTPFACGGCGQSLVVPRGQHLVFAVGLVVLFWLLKERLPRPLDRHPWPVRRHCPAGRGRNLGQDPGAAGRPF